MVSALVSSVRRWEERLDDRRVSDESVGREGVYGRVVGIGYCCCAVSFWRVDLFSVPPRRRRYPTRSRHLVVRSQGLGPLLRRVEDLFFVLREWV